MSLATLIADGKKRWWAFALVVAAIGVLVLARPKPKKEIEQIEIDPETTPTMFTRDAESYVTDSGYTRYKLEAPLWYVFDEAAEPNWKFTRGIYLEKYDDSMRIVATFICDSAVYLSNPKLWEFVGNVRMRNETGDRFLTQQLFWDTYDHKIYSDSFIHIDKADQVIEGHGFTSNENITEYTVRRPTMIIPVSQFKAGERREAADLPVDSLAPDDDSGSPAPARQSVL